MMTAHVGGNESTLSRVLKVNKFDPHFFPEQTFGASTVVVTFDTTGAGFFLGLDLIALVFGVLVFFLLIFLSLL